MEKVLDGGDGARWGAYIKEPTEELSFCSFISKSVDAVSVKDS